MTNSKKKALKEMCNILSESISIEDGCERILVHDCVHRRLNGRWTSYKAILLKMTFRERMEARMQFLKEAEGVKSIKDMMSLLISENPLNSGTFIGDYEKRANRMDTKEVEDKIKAFIEFEAKEYAGEVK